MPVPLLKHVLRHRHLLHCNSSRCVGVLICQGARVTGAASRHKEEILSLHRFAQGCNSLHGPAEYLSWAVCFLVVSLPVWLQVECKPPGTIRVVVTEYTMDNSIISLHLSGVAGAGSLQAVQIGHADGVSIDKPVNLR